MFSWVGVSPWVRAQVLAQAVGVDLEKGKDVLLEKNQSYLPQGGIQKKGSLWASKAKVPEVKTSQTKTSKAKVVKASPSLKSNKSKGFKHSKNKKGKRSKKDRNLSSLEVKGTGISLDVERWTLENGLRVLLHPQPRVPKVFFLTLFNVGSVDEDEEKGETGIAHLLEHLLFQGSRKYSAKEYNRGVESRGISSNAFTSFDYTGYHYNMPPEHLEWIIKVEADRLGWPLLSQKYLDKEKPVVLEERRQRFNAPSSRLFAHSMKMLFKDHSYSHPIIGYVKDITNYTRQQVVDFHHKYYVPSNAVLALAGDFDRTQAKTWIQKHYGKIPSKPLERVNVSFSSSQKEPRTQRFEELTQATSFTVSFQGVEMKSPDSYALDVLAFILGSGSSSRLHRELIHNQQVGIGASASHMSLRNGGIFYVFAQLYPHVKPEKALNLVKRELKKLQTSFALDEEIEKAKVSILKGVVDHLATLDGRAQLLADLELYFGDYQRISEELEYYKKVTVQDVLNVAKKYLNPHQMNINILVPKTKKTLSPPAKTSTKTSAKEESSSSP